MNLLVTSTVPVAKINLSPICRSTTFLVSIIIMVAHLTTVECVVIVIGMRTILVKDVDAITGGSSSFTFTCICENVITLHYNGGELDRVQCKCGKVYTLESPIVQLVMEEK